MDITTSFKEAYARNLPLFRKIMYVSLWGMVSLTSSYNDIIKLDFKFIETGDFYKDIIAPLLIWTLAFFVDYIYTISNIEDKKELLDKNWSQCSYSSIGFIFVVLLISIFHHDTILSRTICMACLFFNMMSLKVSSLYVVRPIINIVKR